MNDNEAAIVDAIFGNELEGSIFREVLEHARPMWGHVEAVAVEPDGCDGWVATAWGPPDERGDHPVLLAAESGRPKALALLREYAIGSARRGAPPRLPVQVAALLSQMDLGEALAALRLAVGGVAVRAAEEAPGLAEGIAGASRALLAAELARRAGFEA